MPSPDGEEYEEASEEAWRIAREIVAKNPATDWPDLPPIVASLAQFLTETQAMDLKADLHRAMNETYFYGLLNCILTIEISVSLNGLVMRFPPMVEPDTMEHAEKLMSFERLLPFIDRDVSAKEATWLADRFRNLAEICDQHAAEVKKGRR